MRVPLPTRNEDLQAFAARFLARYERDYTELSAAIAASGGGGGGAVSSVFGRTGAVVAQAGDYTPGQVGAASALHTHSFASLTSPPTTLSGYGITDGLSSVTLTGDVTGSGGASFATTLANSGVTAGTYGNFTFDAKGRATSAKADWEYLGGAAPLGASNATLLATTTIATRDEIEIRIYLAGYTGAGTGQVQFNASATGHSYRWVSNTSASPTAWAAGTNTGSNTSSIKVGPADTTNPRHIVMSIGNRKDATNGERTINLHSRTGVGSASNAGNIDLCYASFTSTSQITQVGITSSANQFKAGSYVEIWGRNATT